MVSNQLFIFTSMVFWSGMGLSFGFHLELGVSCTTLLLYREGSHGLVMMELTVFFPASPILLNMEINTIIIIFLLDYKIGCNPFFGKESV